MKRMLARLLLVLSVAVAMDASALEEPSVPLAQLDSTIDASTRTQWLLHAGGDAVAAGFPLIAKQLFEVAVSEGAVLSEENVRNFSSALIAGGMPQQAYELLLRHPDKAAWWHLRKGLAQTQMGEHSEARISLQHVEPSLLPDSDTPWLFLAQAAVAHGSGDSATAGATLSKAIEAAPPSLRANFEILALQHQLKTGLVQESVVVDLRQKVADMQSQRGGFEAARLLAVALYQLNRPQEAVAVIEEQLRYVTATEAGMRDQMLLLLAIISGPETGKGRLALQQIMDNFDADRRLHENALNLLSRSLDSEESRRSFKALLDRLLEAQRPHPLADEMLLLRAQITVKEQRYDAASADANQLIELFPASPLRPGAIRLLAYLAWKKQPPQYRTAASYLGQLRQTLPDGPERARLGLLMADCFFLNRDYASAAGAYADLRDEPSADPGLVLYQQVLSELRADRLDAARAILDQAAIDGNVDTESRWRAEWNIINAMKLRGETAAAFARLDALLKAGVAETPPPSLSLRLMWLGAQLSIDAGQPEETPRQCDAILDILNELSADVLGPAQREAIGSHTLLLKAQAHFLLNQQAEALVAVEALRNQYPQSDAAQQSYLAQARYYASQDRLVEAQRLLIALADRFPKGAQAPIALWEAALAAEHRGLDSTFREALSILDRLVGDYPQHYLVFQARLRQGDLLRRLNDFGTALLIYEELINRYPNNPDLYMAWISRADCYSAQASQDPSRRADAIAIYERLVERRDVPVDLRAEAGFKWAHAIERSGNVNEARRAYWQILTRFLAPEEGELLGARGRYWIGRTSIELGQLFEQAAEFEQARIVYEMVLESHLPGQRLVESRLARLQQAQQ